MLFAAVSPSKTLHCANSICQTKQACLLAYTKSGLLCVQLLLVPECHVYDLLYAVESCRFLDW